MELGSPIVAIRNLVLYLDGTANGLNDAGELSDDSVSCTAEDVTPMRGDRLLHHSTVQAQSSCGGLFVKLRKAAVPLHIGSENRSKPTLHGQGTPRYGQFAFVCRARDDDIIRSQLFSRTRLRLLNTLLANGVVDERTQAINVPDQ